MRVHASVCACERVGRGRVNVRIDLICVYVHMFICVRERESARAGE